MNEQTKIKNAKDLKFYKLMIVMTFVASMLIALVVGITTIDSYKAGASATNIFIDILMPKQINGTKGIKGLEDLDESVSKMTFYREKNKDYDVEKDEPLKAFNYYIMNDEGRKIYLEDGMYYPPEYYMENSKTEPVAVYFIFFIKLFQNLQVLKNVLIVFAVIFGLGIFAALIYIWYRSWCRREDARIAREKEFNERFNKKRR